MGGERTDVYGDGQGPASAMTEDDRKDRRCKLRVRWVDTPECSSPIRTVCPWVGDGRGRTRESIFEDAEWCEEVARFLV